MLQDKFINTKIDGHPADVRIFYPANDANSKAQRTIFITWLENNEETYLRFWTNKDAIGDSLAQRLYGYFLAKLEKSARYAAYAEDIGGLYEPTDITQPERTREAKPA